MNEYVIRPTRSGAWQICRDGRDEPLLETVSKGRAVELATHLAAHHTPAHLVLERQDGQTEREWSWEDEERDAQTDVNGWRERSR